MAVPDGARAFRAWSSARVPVILLADASPGEVRDLFRRPCSILAVEAQDLDLSSNLDKSSIDAGIEQVPDWPK
jgi:hypothetical protein